MLFCIVTFCYLDKRPDSVCCCCCCISSCFFPSTHAEILGALLSVFTIWLVTGVLVYLAVERLISDDYTIEGTVMLITSGCAVLANIMWVKYTHRPHLYNFHQHTVCLLNIYDLIKANTERRAMLNPVWWSIKIVCATILYFRRV